MNNLNQSHILWAGNQAIHTDESLFSGNFIQTKKLDIPRSYGHWGFNIAIIKDIDILLVSFFKQKCQDNITPNTSATSTSRFQKMQQASTSWMRIYQMKTTGLSTLKSVTLFIYNIICTDITYKTYTIHIDTNHLKKRTKGKKSSQLKRSRLFPLKASNMIRKFNVFPHLRVSKTSSSWLNRDVCTHLLGNLVRNWLCCNMLLFR